MHKITCGQQPPLLRVKYRAFGVGMENAKYTFLSPGRSGSPLERPESSCSVTKAFPVSYRGSLIGSSPRSQQPFSAGPFFFPARSAWPFVRPRPLFLRHRAPGCRVSGASVTGSIMCTQCPQCETSPAQQRRSARD